MADAIKPLPAWTTAMVTTQVLAPLIARGLIIRRQGAMTVLSRVNADQRAIDRLRAVRDLHGPGPALLRLPDRRLALVLTGEDARTVLEGSPEPFTPANLEKRAALRRFEPHGVLISPSRERPPRRRFNEEALETGHPVHRSGHAIAVRVRAEAETMLEHADRSGRLRWPQFEHAFNRIVRGVVLGEHAANDEWLTDELNSLRRDANWGYLLPERRALRERFLERLRAYVSRPQPGTLSHHVTVQGGTPEAVEDAVDQIPQWLFAFDAAGIATLTTLALLSTHGPQMQAAHEEIDSTSGGDAAELPFLRACVLESLRLWPTTPAILRDTTTETSWATGLLPAGSGLLIFTPLFHRDSALRPAAGVFAPERWLQAGADGLRPDELDPLAPLIPFSHGPVRCPGREVVLLVTTQLIAHVLERAEVRIAGALEARLQPGAPLPATLSHFQLELDLRAMRVR